MTFNHADSGMELDGRLRAAIEAFSDGHCATRRERDVLTSLVFGHCSREELARALDLSRHTVGEHLRHLTRRLRVNSTTDVLIALIQFSLAARPGPTRVKRHLCVDDAIKPVRFASGPRSYVLSDKQWERVQPVLPIGTARSNSKLDRRWFIDAILYRAATGTAWHELPTRFGRHKNVYARFRSWQSAGVWERVFAVLRIEVEVEGGAAGGWRASEEPLDVTGVGA